MASRAHLFSHEGQAKAYGQFRPHYDQSLYDAIYAYAGEPQLDRALDVATGSGQAAAAIAKRYGTVIAQDASAEQLSAAGPRGTNISFQVARAEATGQPDASFDLVTVAEALHWFDIPSFYAEAARVLRPGGTLSVWGYGLSTFVDEPDATEALRTLFEDVLGPYWDPKRLLVEAKYEGVEPGPPLFTDVQRSEFSMRKTVTVGEFMGHLNSWSAYHSWRAAKVPGPDPLLKFHADLKEALEFTSHSETCEIEYPMFRVLARKA